MWFANFVSWQFWSWSFNTYFILFVICHIEYWMMISYFIYIYSLISYLHIFGAPLSMHDCSLLWWTVKEGNGQRSASTGKPQKMQPLPKKNWTWIWPRTHKIKRMDTQLVLTSNQPHIFFGWILGWICLFGSLKGGDLDVGLLYMCGVFSPSFLRIGLANWQGCWKKGAVDWDCCINLACLPNVVLQKILLDDFYWEFCCKFSQAERKDYHMLT